MSRSDSSASDSVDWIKLSPEEWQARLTREQYQVARKGGTERAFTGAYWNHKAAGMYCCVCCGAPLFSSATKFDSGTGWPSFSDGVKAGAITTHRDTSHGMSELRSTVLAVGLIWAMSLTTDQLLQVRGTA